MRSLSCIALVFGLLATHGFEAAPANAKSGSGAQGSSGDSPSGGSGIGGGRGVGSSPSATVTVDGRGEGNGIRTSTGRESGGSNGPSSASVSNGDNDSGSAFGGSIGGPLGFGSSWSHRPPSTWFNGLGGNSRGGRRSLWPQGAFSEQSNFDGVEGRFRQPGGSSGLSGQSEQDWFGYHEDRKPSGFEESGYQGSRGGLFGSQGRQGGSNVFGGTFGGFSFGGTPGFDSAFGGFGRHENLGNSFGNPNFAGLSGGGGQGGLSEANSFGSGLLEAISGLSNFGSLEGDSESGGRLFGSRRTSRFGQRLLALRSLPRQYLIYRQNGGRRGFFQFLRKRRFDTQSRLRGAQTGSFGGSSGSSSVGSGNDLGQQQFFYWPRRGFGRSFESRSGFTGEFGNVDEAFSQQRL